MIALREKMHLKERIVLCYLGGLQKWQCVEETLDIFLRLKKKDDRYFLCIYTNDDLISNLHSSFNNSGCSVIYSFKAVTII